MKVKVGTKVVLMATVEVEVAFNEEGVDFTIAPPTLADTPCEFAVQFDRDELPNIPNEQGFKHQLVHLCLKQMFRAALHKAEQDDAHFNVELEVPLPDPGGFKS